MRRTSTPVSPTRRQLQQTTNIETEALYSQQRNRPASPRPAQSPSRLDTSSVAISELSYAFKPSGKYERDTYLKESQRMHDLCYDVPGMADIIKKKSSGIAFSKMTSDRRSFASTSRHVTGLFYDLPGMATKPDTRAATFKGTGHCGPEGRFSSPVGRGTEKRACHDLHYNVPDIVEELRRSKKGSASFRATSPRLMYIPPPSPAHDIPARSAIGTIAHECNSPTRTQSPLKCSASFRMTSPRFPSPKKGSGSPFTVESYDLPGIAANALKSPGGTCSFRNSSCRDSYVKAFPRTNDLIYDLPGIGGKIYHQSEESVTSPTRGRTANVTSPLRGSPARYLSPTAASRAKERRQPDTPGDASQSM